MEFRILGPLEVRADGRAVALGGARPRALLAVLLLHANEPVGAERLALALWGEDAPAAAVKTVQVYVSRLRKALGQADVLTTTPGGYRLQAEPGELDLERFERRLTAGRGALGAGRAEEAASLLRDALALWRGAPLEEFAWAPFAPAAITRLEEQRLSALELRVDADLAAGRHAELIPELQQLTREHPWREHLHEQLLLALYRAGRQADALEAYRQARGVFAEQLGIEPGPELRRLEQAILGHDPTLQAPASVPAVRRLPEALSRTVGRERDLQEVADRLAEHDVRLITLTGPGGVGKTRLSVDVARAVAAAFRDGVWFVPLAATAQPAHLASTVAQALEVTPLGGETPEDAVSRFLAGKKALLVLDNLEHLLPGAGIVAELLAECPGLKVLATSREPLRLQAEHCFEVLPLPVPVDGDRADVERTPASALFAALAHRHDASFTVTEANAAPIADICRRLDGLPLAIELAAARTPLLSPQELSARLAASLDALGHGARDAPARQRTLRAAIDWSYRLLRPEEAPVFVRFSVFAGGATVQAAEVVTGGDLDGLEGLVEKHLLQRRASSTGETRLVMLETVREYARERLDADGDALETRRRHCLHYVALAESAEPALDTGAEAEWLPRLDAEVDNLRAALEWSLRDGDPALGLRLASLLTEFWDVRGMVGEGLEWLQRALGGAGDDAPLPDRARAVRAEVKLLEEQGSVYDAGGLREHARARALEALALSRETGDPSAIADALVLLGHLEANQSLPQRRRYALAEEAFAYARRAGDRRLMAHALADRAAALVPEEAFVELQEAFTALREIGAVRSLATLASGAAYNAITAGRPDLAGPLLDQALSLARQLEEQDMLTAVYGNVGLAALFTGELDDARAAFEQQLRACRERGLAWFASEGLAGLAAIAARRGDLERAARLIGAAPVHGPVGHPDVIARLERDFFAPARASYGEREWARAQATGAALSLADATELALEAGTSAS